MNWIRKKNGHDQNCSEIIIFWIFFTFVELMEWAFYFFFDQMNDHFILFMTNGIKMWNERNRAFDIITF